MPGGTPKKVEAMKEAVPARGTFVEGPLGFFTDRELSTYRETIQKTLLGDPVANIQQRISQNQSSERPVAILDLGAGEGIAASVLYLFQDPALGGTAFFRPKQPIARIAELVQASSKLAPAAFTERYGIPPGYPTASNAWFERVAAVPARFNRLIFYPGNVFHSADIGEPARLVADPRAGRLTLNGFFVFRRSLA